MGGIKERPDGYKRSQFLSHLKEFREVLELAWSGHESGERFRILPFHCAIRHFRVVILAELQSKEFRCFPGALAEKPGLCISSEMTISAGRVAHCVADEHPGPWEDAFLQPRPEAS